MACINHKNLLCHDFWTVWFKPEDRNGMHWGFTIHNVDCRTEEYDPEVARPVYSVHPKLIARTMIEKSLTINDSISTKNKDCN